MNTNVLLNHYDEVSKFVKNNQNAENIFAKMLSENNDIELYYDISTPSACTNGEIIKVNPQFHNLYEHKDYFVEAYKLNQWDKAKEKPIDFDTATRLYIINHGLLIHECLHLLYTDFPVTNFENVPYKHQPFVHKIHNIIEDSYIEKAGSEEFTDVKYHLQLVNALIAIKLKEKENKTEDDVPPLYKALKYISDNLLYPQANTPYPTDVEAIKYIEATQELFYLGSIQSECEKRKEYAILIYEKIKELGGLPEISEDKDFDTIIKSQELKNSRIQKKGKNYQLQNQPPIRNQNQGHPNSQNNSPDNKTDNQQGQGQSASADNEQGNDSNSQNNNDSVPQNNNQSNTEDDTNGKTDNQQSQGQSGSTNNEQGNNGSNHQNNNKNSANDKANNKQGQGQSASADNKQGNNKQNNGAASENNNNSESQNSKQDNNNNNANDKANKQQGQNQSASTDNEQNNNSASNKNNKNQQSQAHSTSSQNNQKSNEKTEDNSPTSQNNNQNNKNNNNQQVPGNHFNNQQQKPTVDFDELNRFIKQLKADIKEAKSTTINEKTTKGEEKNLNSKDFFKAAGNDVKNFKEITYTAQKKHIIPYNKIKEELKYVIKRYKNKFCELIKGKSECYDGKYLCGNKINTKKLYDTKKRYWQKKAEELDTPELTIQLLIDESGSMSGSNIYNAITASVLLHEILEPNNIEHSIAGFSSRREIEHNLVLDFNHKKNDKYNIMRLSSGGCNRDGLAVKWALKRLLKQQIENKVLLVISDGTPSDYRNREDINKDFSDIKKICKKHNIQIIAIALENSPNDNCLTNALKQYYKNVLTCHNPEDLPLQIANTITKLIK